MNARLLLLVLVTGLFMAAWDGDQAAMEAAIARRDQRIADARLALLKDKEENAATAWLPVTDEDVASELKHSLTVAANTKANSVDMPVEPVSQHKEVASIEVPLPPGIPSGDYQAVNQSNGNSIRITVDKESGKQARDFYTVDDDNGQRWYIIRISTNTADLPAGS